MVVWTSDDQDLADRESDFIRQSQKTSRQQVSEAFRRRLNRAIKLKVPGLAVGNQRGNKLRPPKPKPAVELYPEPTTFTGPETVTALVGVHHSIYMEANAIDGFIPDRGAINIAPEPGAPAFAFGVGDLRNGRLRIDLAVPDDATTGIYVVNLSLEWLRSSGGWAQLPWAVKVNVVTELPDKKPSGYEQNKPAATGDIAFYWSRTDEEDWEYAQVAGDLQFLKGEDLAARNSRAYGHLRDVHEPLPTIVLNQDFPDWLNYRKAIHPKLTDEGWRMREDRYGLAVGVAVARLFLNERKVRKQYDAWKARGSEPPEPSQPMTPDQLQRAIAEAARGVIALMPDFDQLLGDVGLPNDTS